MSLARFWSVIFLSLCVFNLQIQSTLIGVNSVYAEDDEVIVEGCTAEGEPEAGSNKTYNQCIQEMEAKRAEIAAGAGGGPPPPDLAPEDFTPEEIGWVGILSSYLNLLLMLAMGFLIGSVFKGCYGLTADVVTAGIGGLVYIAGELYALLAFKELKYESVHLEKDKVDANQIKTLKDEKKSYEDARNVASIKMGLQIAAGVAFLIAFFIALTMESWTTSSWIACKAALVADWGILKVQETTSSMEKEIAQSCLTQCLLPKPPPYSAFGLCACSIGGSGNLGCIAAGAGVTPQATAAIAAENKRMAELVAKEKEREAKHLKKVAKLKKYKANKCGKIENVDKKACAAFALPAIPMTDAEALKMISFTVASAQCVENAGLITAAAVPCKTAAEGYTATKLEAANAIEASIRARHNAKGGPPPISLIDQDVLEMHAESKAMKAAETAEKAGASAAGAITQEAPYIACILGPLDKHIAECKHSIKNLDEGYNALMTKLGDVDSSTTGVEEARLLILENEAYHESNCMFVTKTNVYPDFQTPLVPMALASPKACKAVDISVEASQVKCLPKALGNPANLVASAPSPGSFDFMQVLGDMPGMDWLFPTAYAQTAENPFQMWGILLAAAAFLITMFISGAEWMDPFMAHPETRKWAWLVGGLLASATGLMTLDIVLTMGKNIESLDALIQKWEPLVGTPTPTATAAPVAGGTPAGPDSAAGAPPALTSSTTTTTLPPGTPPLPCMNPVNGQCPPAEEVLSSSGGFGGIDTSGSVGEGLRLLAKTADGISGKNGIDTGTLANAKALGQQANAIKKAVKNLKDKINFNRNNAGQPPLDLAGGAKAFLAGGQAMVQAALTKHGTTAQAALAGLSGGAPTPGNLKDEKGPADYKMPSFGAGSSVAAFDPSALGAKDAATKFNWGGEKPAVLKKDNALLSDSDLAGMKELDYGKGSEISTNKDISIFQLLSKRYLTSGIRRLTVKPKQ